MVRFIPVVFGQSSHIFWVNPSINFLWARCPGSRWICLILFTHIIPYFSPSFQGGFPFFRILPLFPPAVNLADRPAGGLASTAGRAKARAGGDPPATCQGDPGEISGAASGRNISWGR